MDKIDRKILSLLQENARYPLKYLAQKVFLSSPAVSTMELDTFIGHLQRFGNTQTQIVFSTAVPPRGVGIETDDLEKE